MEVTLTVTEQADLDALTWARERYNEQPATDADGEPVLMPDNASYVLFVARSAIDSYKVQKLQAERVAALG